MHHLLLPVKNLSKKHPNSIKVLSVKEIFYSKKLRLKLKFAFQKILEFKNHLIEPKHLVQVLKTMKISITVWFFSIILLIRGGY